MSLADEQQYDEKLLRRYLLGAVSEEEAERLDESSIADAAFAAYLDAVENDLVDAYVERALSGETLERFESFYLSSPKRREKVEFAKALLRAVESGHAVAQPSASAVSGWFTMPRLGLQWGFAGAALAMLLACSYLMVENGRLKKSAAESQERQARLDRQLNEQLSANSETQKELQRLREASQGPSALNTLAFLLLPQTRGIGPLATITLPHGTEQAELRLRLEADDFAQYRAAVRDSAGSRVIWQSAPLKSASAGEGKEVAIRLPANLLGPGIYSVELSGLRASGSSELVTSYSFRLAKK